MRDGPESRGAERGARASGRVERVPGPTVEGPRVQLPSRREAGGLFREDALSRSTGTPSLSPVLPLPRGLSPTPLRFPGSHQGDVPASPIGSWVGGGNHSCRAPSQLLQLRLLRLSSPSSSPGQGETQSPPRPGAEPRGSWVGHRLRETSFAVRVPGLRDPRGTPSRARGKLGVHRAACPARESGRWKPARGAGAQGRRAARPAPPGCPPPGVPRPASRGSPGVPGGPAGSGRFPSGPRDEDSLGSVPPVSRGDPGGRQDGERGWGGGIGTPVAGSQGGGQARGRERGRPGFRRAKPAAFRKAAGARSFQGAAEGLRLLVARPPAPSALEGQLEGDTRPELRERLFAGPVTDGRAAASGCPYRV